MVVIDVPPGKQVQIGLLQGSAIRWILDVRYASPSTSQNLLVSGDILIFLAAGTKVVPQIYVDVAQRIGAGMDTTHFEAIRVS
ncbi:hypothetical protein D3C76_372700 [compost metagenome]